MERQVSAETGSAVLHALRCIGHASAARLSVVTGLPESVTESELTDLATSGNVIYTPGDFGGWGLTEAGRALDARQIADELELPDTQSAVTESYRRFLMLNAELLDLCSAWQMRSVDGIAAANDHSDPGYDTRILDRLIDLDRRAQSVFAPLATATDRFARYRTRLADALTRARTGAREYVATDTESYHAVWFQLHEDLLVTLGIERFR